MKPRVLHFVDSFLERSEVFIYNYITAHSQWEPTVLTKRRMNENDFPLNDVVTISAPVTKRSPAWWKDLAIERSTGRSPWQRAAEKFIANLDPAVIHAHFGHVAYELLPIKKRLGLPLITTFYGYDMSVLPRQKKWRKRFERLFQGGDLFLVEGPCMKQRLVELGAPSEKVSIQRIAINPKRYPGWKPATTPTVLFVGRFTEKKGLLAALAAFDDVRRSRPDATLRIIGDGEQRDAAQSFVKDNGMNGAAVFRGMRSHDEVIQELQKAHVLIHPSVTAENGDTEGGAPTVLLEAQMIGTPIVSTLHADIPNIVRSGKGVYLSAERDAAMLSHNLDKALRLLEASDSAYVREFHNVDNEVLRLEKRYENCLTDKSNYSSR